MTTPTTWEQPDPPRRQVSLPAWARVALPIAVGLTPGVALLAGLAIPPFAAVAAAAGGIGWAFSRASIGGGPWHGFITPAEATFVPHDPEFGARLEESLALQDHKFQNIVSSMAGVWRWTFVEAVRSGARQRLVVIGFDRPLPAFTAELRFRSNQNGTAELIKAIRESGLPGTVVGRTGNYSFVGAPPGWNDPGVLTAIVTPAFTEALEQMDAFGSWQCIGHQLVGRYDREELQQRLPYRSIKRAGIQLAAVADALAASLDVHPRPPEAPESWPTL